MNDEKHHLLSNADGEETVDGGHESSATVSETLRQLQRKLKEEKDKNVQLERKVEDLTAQFEKLNTLYKSLSESKTDELEKLRTTMEARTELQASSIDELRFQIQSMRNKLDLTRTQIAESNGPSSPVKLVNPKLTNLNDDSPRTLIRQRSDDSNGTTGSSPCLLSRLNMPQRTEFTWRINGFTKKLKKIQSGSYDDPSRSEAFTTGPCGYRLSIWVYLNGRGKGADKCLSVYIRVVAGEFDPILSWPIKPCYTFYLISQDADVSKRLDLVRVRDLSIKHGGIFRPHKEDKSIIVGFDDFIVHEDIEKKNFLLDDSIFLRCVVEVPLT